MFLCSGAKEINWGPFTFDTVTKIKPPQHFRIRNENDTSSIKYFYRARPTYFFAQSSSEYWYAFHWFPLNVMFYGSHRIKRSQGKRLWYLFNLNLMGILLCVNFVFKLWCIWVSGSCAYIYILVSKFWIQPYLLKTIP